MIASLGLFFFYSAAVCWVHDVILVSYLSHRKVLSALDTTRNDSKKMKDQHRDVMLKYYNVVDDTAAVLKKLTQKATTLEKLKAKIGS